MYVFYLQKIPPHGGGVGSYVYNLVNNFPKETEVHILTIGRNVDFSYKEIYSEGHENVHVHEIVKIDDMILSSII